MYRTVCVLFLLGSASAQAAPRLQPYSSSLYLSAAQDSTATSGLEVSNFGDGTLNLTFTTLAPWLSVVDDGACLAVVSCFVKVVANTTGMAVGRLVGAVRVSDPAAINAPQDVTVIVDVGGGFPDHLMCVVPPGGQGCSATIDTPWNTFDVAQMGALPKGVTVNWSFARLGGGGGLSQRLPRFYLVVYADTIVPEGLIQTAITVSGLGSGIADKTIPIDIQVTRQPIARWTSDTFGPEFFSIYFDAASGVAPREIVLPITNGGLGDLSLLSATSDSDWFTATVADGAVTIVVDPAGLAPGHYAGTLTVASNSFVPIVVPVQFDAFELGAPSVLNSSSSLTSAPGDLVTLTGLDFTAAAPVRADTAQDLPTSLNGVRVLIGVEPVPLLSIAYDTIQFQVPNQVRGTSLTVERDGMLSIGIPVQRVECQPFLTGIFDSDGNRVDANDQNAYRPAPIAAGAAITVIGHGFGLTTPPVPAGKAIDDDVPYEVASDLQTLYPNAVVRSSVGAKARLVPGLIGVYRIDTTVPDTPGESAYLRVSTCGMNSNALLLSVK